MSKRPAPLRPRAVLLAAGLLPMLAGSALAGQLPGSPPDVPRPPLAPDAVLDIPGGPRLIHFEAPGTAAASLRLSIPLGEAPAEAGSGRVLVLAALERVRPLAHRVGARIEGVRTFHGIAYTVTGPSAAFDHLAWLVRELVREPDQAGISGALARLRVELEQGGETPSGVLESRLREGVAPELPPLSGSPATLAALDWTRVREVWRRSHLREVMTVVAAAPVPVEVLLAGILDAGVPEGGGGEGGAPPPPRSGQRVRSEVLRSWYGEAYPIDTADDPRSAVAARMMAARLESLPGRVEAGVQLWELGGRAALVVTGAAYSGEASTMRRTIQGIREGVTRDVTPGEVEQIVGDLRAETLLGARSNRGLAAVVGYHLDATGDPLGAQVFLESLAALDHAAMSAFLQDLLQRSPVVADVRP